MKVLLVYPNLFGMNMLPPAIGILNSCLKAEGHVTDLFDTTSYSTWHHLDIDSDKLKEERLNARPYDDSILRESARTGSPTAGFVAKVREFSPDLLAFSVTEDMYPNALELLRGLDPKERPPVVLGGVFPTFAPELALRKSCPLVPAHVERLEQIINRALVEGINGIVIMCSQKNDVTRMLGKASHIYTAQAGHAHIQKDDVGAQIGPSHRH